MGFEVGFNVFEVGFNVGFLVGFDRGCFEVGFKVLGFAEGPPTQL